MIKVTREEAAATRTRILAEAARSFREHGFSGVSLADMMQRAGRTHGGFYGHFRSKEDLMAQACRHAVGTMLEEWAGVAEGAPGTPLEAIVAHYLSSRHRDQPGSGCLMAALGADVSRQPAPVRQAVTESLEAVLDFLARLTPGKSAAVRREKAIALFASLVGALVTARAVNDPRLSQEILHTLSKSIAPR